MTCRLSHLLRLNGSNLGVSDSIAVRLNYAKGYACGSEGFLKAIACSQIYAKRSARGSRAFKMQRILPILRHEQVLK